MVRTYIFSRAVIQEIWNCITLLFKQGLETTGHQSLSLLYLLLFLSLSVLPYPSPSLSSFVPFQFLRPWTNSFPDCLNSIQSLVTLHDPLKATPIIVEALNKQIYKQANKPTKSLTTLIHGDFALLLKICMLTGTQRKGNV